MTQPAATKRRRFGRKLPPVGTVLTHHYRRSRRGTITASVVEAPSFAEGRASELQGKLYRSMSAAAQVLTRSAVNGWVFWKW